YLCAAELLGFDSFIPPFVTARGKEILKGVNYASGVAGIRDETGYRWTLYSYGARKVAVSNIGLLGCLPEELEVFGRNASGCVDFINNYVKLFNDKLKLLIDDLNINLPNARFIYINQTSISSGGPSPVGFTVDSSCCITSDTIAKGQCRKGEVPCNNRNQYIFFDNFHPTEIANMATARRSFNAFLPSDAYPTDISQLVQT
uniref:GDSL esterase/lipase At1g29670 n=1 Tax=Nicotiana tabacum TaxID=4097 RepID=A0A1S3YAB5_TOBAC